MSEIMTNFKIIQNLDDVTIDGKKGIRFISSFDLAIENDKIETVRSWTYAIPVGKYFYQINYSDIQGEDCSSIYETVTNSIKFP